MSAYLFVVLVDWLDSLSTDSLPIGILSVCLVDFSDDPQKLLSDLVCSFSTVVLLR
jgi:hypothetical protein